MTLRSINPATGKLIREYEEMNTAQIVERIQSCKAAFDSWRETPFAERTSLLNAAACVLRENREKYARLMATEMGKPIRDGRAEVEKCAWACEHYAEHAASLLAVEMVQTDARKSYVSFQPMGVILAIMPWNYPFWQVFRFAAPALMAGNGAILKHASNVSGCALAIERIFIEAGFPEHIFQTVLVPGKATPPLIEHPSVRAVTLTGSKPAGQAVAKTASRLIKKTVLELGGSDPYLILEDADLEKAVATCVASRLLNSGQSCIAAKRFIVVNAVHKAFENLLVEQMAAQKMGDPLDEEVAIGPQARADLRVDLHRQVRESIDRGARCLLGGELPEGPGAFYPPTVLTGVRRGMPAFDEETFGPVAAIVSVKDEHEAIDVANDSLFGLGAGVFTQDLERGERIARDKLEAGNCFVNDFVKSHPRLPFGGIKESGYGRELSSYGIKEFVNIKTVYIK